MTQTTTDEYSERLIDAVRAYLFRADWRECPLCRKLAYAPPGARYVPLLRHRRSAEHWSALYLVRRHDLLAVAAVLRSRCT
jgi:hypothetical protein